MIEHREICHTHQLTYWRGNVAADRATADRVRLEVRYGAFLHVLEFPARDDTVLLKVEDMLSIVFDAGRAGARAEIRRALGIKD